MRHPAGRLCAPPAEQDTKVTGLAVTAVHRFSTDMESEYGQGGMLKVMHEVFGFVPVVMPWISAAGFLLLICLLCWRERGWAATAEIAKAQTMQTLASSTQTKEVNDIRAVFQESRLFTSARN